MSTAPLRPRAPSEALGKSTLSAWVELAKPGITRLVLFTTGFGAWLAPGQLGAWAWGATLCGTAGIVAGANALNQVAEVRSDALMARTRGRPLPTGRLTVSTARSAAYAVSLCGVGLLLSVHWMCVVLACLALAVYVWLYTPLKRYTPHAVYVGAIPGAIPPLIGYAAANHGELDSLAWAFFALMCVWQIPHFLAIAIFRQSEYARAGLRVFSVSSSGRTVRWLVIGWSLALLGVSLLPPLVAHGGSLYLSLAWAFGLAFSFGATLGLRPGAGDEWARSLFFATLPYLVLLCAGLACA